jgi:hypothetical protein
MPVELRLSSRLTLSGVIVAVLLSASRALAGNYEDGKAAYERGDYPTAFRLFLWQSKAMLSQSSP